MLNLRSKILAGAALLVVASQLTTLAIMFVTTKTEIIDRARQNLSTTSAFLTAINDTQASQSGSTVAIRRVPRGVETIAEIFHRRSRGSSRIRTVMSDSPGGTSTAPYHWGSVECRGQFELYATRYGTDSPGRRTRIR